MEIIPIIPWNSMEFHGNCIFHRIQWKTFSMEFHGKHSMEFHGKHSMEFHGIPCPIPDRIPWNSMEKVPWNSMEFHGVILHGYDIKWRKVKQARSYSNVTKRCNLCLWEKFFILCRPEMSTLNRRNELTSCCRHARKFLPKNVII